MPSNEERREIAARLRRFKVSDTSSPWDYLDKLDEIIGLDYGCEETGERLPDLIEPEERTCRMEYNEEKSTVYCSNCGEQMDDYMCDWFSDETNRYSYPFCCECGAKVVEYAD